MKSLCYTIMLVLLMAGLAYAYTCRTVTINTPQGMKVCQVCCDSNGFCNQWCW
jgi:hypothetical protein